MAFYQFVLLGPFHRYISYSPNIESFVVISHSGTLFVRKGERLEQSYLQYSLSDNIDNVAKHLKNDI